MLLEQLIVPLKMDSSQFNKETKGAKSKAGDLASSLLSMGSTAVIAGITGVAIAIAGIAKVSLDAFNNTKDWALQLDSIQDVMGVSNEKAATYAFVAKKAGVNIESLTNAQTILAKQLVDAKGELDTTGKALKEWGVNVLDANGKLKDQATITDEIAKKYSELGSQTERVAFLNDAFGRSGADLIDFFDTLAADGGVDAVTEKVKKLGLALDPAKFEEFQRSQEELKLTWLGLQATLGQALLPAAQNLLNKFLEFAQNPAVQETFKNIIGSATELASSLGQMGGDIAEKIGGFFKEIKLDKYLQDVIDTAKGFFKDPKNTIINLAELRDNFIKNFDFNKISKDLAEKIKSIDWNNLGNTVGKMVVDAITLAFTINFKYGWGSFFKLLKELFTEVDWLALLYSISEAVTDFFFGLFGTTKEMFASVVVYYIEKYVNMIKQFFINLYDNTIGKVVELISSVKNKFLSFDWHNLGSNIIKGIANGIRNSIGWITDAAREAARAALTAAKNFLGIHSPSKVFEMQVGYQMAAGTVKGWESGLDNLLQPSFNNLVPATEIIPTTPRIETTESINSNDSILEILREIADNVGIDYDKLARKMQNASMVRN